MNASLIPIWATLAIVGASEHGIGHVLDEGLSTPMPADEPWTMIDQEATLTAQCTTCHEFDNQFSHPVDIAPPSSMRVPENLPLVDGLVTCLTCHPASGAGHSGSVVGFLMQSQAQNRAATLCAQCHDPSEATVQSMHALSMGWAHASSKERIGPEWRASTSGGFGWGGPRDSCLTCHDGAMATGGDTYAGSLSRETGEWAGQGHPVEIAYRVSDPSGADGGLVPLAMLDERVQLVNNRVGCRSCHNLYSTEPSLLVMSNENSQLCLSCHEY